MEAQFIVSRFYTPKNVTLSYYSHEYSFFTNDRPSYLVDYEFYINYLCFTSWDRLVGIADVGGLDPYQRWIPRALRTPTAEKRDLLPKGRYEGIVSGINQTEAPRYYDKESNWFCCGDPDQAGVAVQFTEQAIAVLNDRREITAVWLNPVLKSNCYKKRRKFATAIGVDESRILVSE